MSEVTTIVEIPVRRLQISKNVKVGLISKSVLLIQVTISIVVPLSLLLVYRSYALKAGLILESGCHGPELPFGMLSGILLALQLRFIP